MWPQSKLQFEYAGSKINFDELRVQFIRFIYTMEECTRNPSIH